MYGLKPFLARCISFGTVFALAGCASLETRHGAEKRAAALVLKAEAAARDLAANRNIPAATKEYNTAAADLAVVLKRGARGDLWNRPLELEVAQHTFRLSYAPAKKGETWPAAAFVRLLPSSKISRGILKRVVSTDGVGGTMVGVDKRPQRTPFYTTQGVSAPVTATVDFQGENVIIALRDPRSGGTINVGGSAFPLAANYTAPLSYYRGAMTQIFTGIMGALRVSHYLGSTGLYFSEPYDPHRIPLLLVHGLISTPHMWLNVVNEIKSDPDLRKLYQVWVFAYPTGNPVAYSALRLREELSAVYRDFPNTKPAVLVGHSMGGLLARMQASSFTISDWEKSLGPAGLKALSLAPEGSQLRRALLFDANPNVARLVFIATPHRGSPMALGGIGQIGMKLIQLPADLFGNATNIVGEMISIIAPGEPKVPNSVASLSPSNPLLKLMDQVPIQAPYHSIIGNRGKKGPLAESSDGVVRYQSSHLVGAQSELVVPGPHGCCDLPQTYAEIRRILRLHAGLR